MKTLDYLTGPGAELWWPSIAASVAIALLGGLLSVPVVLKRLAFIGQGVSHAAFGGAGIALVLGLVGTSAAASMGYLGVVGAFCVATAIGVAWVSSRSTGSRSADAEDTVIGVFLVASMALGALLTSWHRRHAPAGVPAPNAEALLFGSLLDVGWADALLAWTVLAIATVVLVHQRRALVFWMFDEPAAAAFGVRTGAQRYLLLTLLGVATVTAMKLAGAVLATALLVLPGAAAVRLSERLNRVVVIAAAAGLLGVGSGLVASFEMDWPPGACVVMALVAIYAAAAAVGAVRRRG